MNFFRLRHAAWHVFAFLLAAAVPVASAQTPPSGHETSAASVASYALGDQMPVDPEVLVGALPNGLRFDVRPNGKPARQAELRLVVKAGCVLEDDDQRGLAHFVEHMLFEGTKHFPGQGINGFLGSLGLSIGADANAATSFDETQYTLRVPTDVPGVLDRALTILEDWAVGATFDPSGIERQRAIVLAEWRMNLGADERTADKVRRVQLEGSRYADRSPIGDPDIIQRAQREQLTRFYRDWYRPDLMAVIVVGDINRDAVVAMIKQHFSSLASPTPKRPRTAFDVTDRPGTRYAVITATELARAKQATMASYERSVTESPDRESASRADEYTRNFLQDEALPTIWQELAFHRRFLGGITLAEINALTADWFPNQNRL